MRQSKAFTLIELLVVISVIAILLAIMLPALSKAKNLAQGSACKGNLKNYCYAVAMYTDESDGSFPVPERCYFSQITAYSGRGRAVQLHPLALVQRRSQSDEDHPEYGGPFFRYIANAQAFICPTFKTLAVRNSDDHFYVADMARLKHYKPWYNYTMNAYLGSENSGVQKTARQEDHGGQASCHDVSPSWKRVSLVDTAYNVSGLNDTFMVPGDDSMIQGWFAKVGPNPALVIPGPEGVGAVLGCHRRLPQRPRQRPARRPRQLCLAGRPRGRLSACRHVRTTPTHARSGPANDDPSCRHLEMQESVKCAIRRSRAASGSIRLNSQMSVSIRRATSG